MPYHFHQTPKQRAWEKQWQREQDAYSRDLCEAFRFWRDCQEPRCRREHACSGDPQACSSRGWARLPEDEKVWFRAAIKAMLAGASFDEATRIADAEKKRWHALQAEVAELFGRHRSAK